MSVKVQVANKQLLTYISQLSKLLFVGWLKIVLLNSKIEVCTTQVITGVLVYAQHILEFHNSLWL